MSQAFEIPLTPNAQKFQITLAGKTYNMVLSWNSFSQLWALDINDSNNVSIVSSILLVANVDLLSPYGYLNFGGALVAQTDNNLDLPPTYENFGITSHLYFVIP